MESGTRSNALAYYSSGDFENMLRFRRDVGRRLKCGVLHASRVRLFSRFGVVCSDGNASGSGQSPGQPVAMARILQVFQFELEEIPGFQPLRCDSSQVELQHHIHCDMVDATAAGILIRGFPAVRVPNWDEGHDAAERL